MTAAPDKKRFAGRWRNSDRRNGAALVEMALVLPVFIAVVLGIVEFGRAMMVTQVISNAAREGARAAILNGSTNAAVTSEVQNFVSTSCKVPTNQVTVTITITPGPGNVNPANQLASSNEGDIVTVNVSVPFSQLSYIRASFLGSTTIRGVATMRHE